MNDTCCQGVCDVVLHCFSLWAREAVETATWQRSPRKEVNGAVIWGGRVREPSPCWILNHDRPQGLQTVRGAYGIRTGKNTTRWQSRLYTDRVTGACSSLEFSVLSSQCWDYGSGAKGNQGPKGWMELILPWIESPPDDFRRLWLSLFFR